MASTSKTLAAQPDAGNSPGRPKGVTQDKVRSDLLQAARDQFLEKEFKAVSVRQIAEAAGVNSAMVNYYFGSKQGLYLAMVDELIELLETGLQDLHSDSEPGVEQFSRSYSRLLADNPWWPNFIVREVLFGNSDIRDLIIDKFGSLMASRLIRTIHNDIASGHYRSDLNPELTVLSLISMTIFPFLAKPVVEGVFKTRLSRQKVEQMTRHNVDLFLNGVLAGTGE